VISQLDLFSLVGLNVAYMTSFEVSVTDGTLDLSFVATADNPVLNAIEVLKTTTVSSGPSSMDFGSVFQSSSASDTLYVYFWTSESVTINSASCTDESFSVPMEMPYTMSGNTIPVMFAPIGSGPHSGELTIETSAGYIFVSVSGTGVSVATSLVASSDLAFGTVLLGSSYTMTLTLTNTGSTSTSVDAMEITEPFTMAEISMPMTLIAGGTLDVEVTYTPTVEGIATGTMSITSGSAIITVALSGEGKISATSYLRINCGSKTDVYVDDLGNTWGVDVDYTNGLVYVNTASISTNGLNLYNTERYWTDKTVKGSYAIPVVAGTYRVDMMFMESWAKAAGVRVFDIYVNGVLVQESFDIFATAGANVAITVTSQLITFDADTTLTIEFVHVFAADGVTSYNNPKVNAIEVVKLS